MPLGMDWQMRFFSKDLEGSMVIKMKKILGKIAGRVHSLHNDSRGMSLVEVLCAVAILALVSGVIGSVIVISTRTYSRGVSETNIQQEAQLAANNIGDIIKDACSVIYAESGADYVKDGEVYEEDGTTPKVPDPFNPAVPKTGETGVTELSIITNDKKLYTVKYYSSTEELKYEVDSTDSTVPSESVAPQLMAKNISRFEADTSDFMDSKSIKLKMTVKDGDREIPMEYTMTSRNGAGIGVAYTPTSDSSAIMIAENEVVLVPGEEYRIQFSVLGDIKKEDLRWDSSTGFEDVDRGFDIDASDRSDGSAWIKVPIGTDEKTVSLVIKAVDESGVEKGQGTITVHVRKVEQVKVSYSVNTDDTASGMMEETGTKLTFGASVSGNALAKGVAYDYDKNYKTAQAVVWNIRLHADGRDIERKWECTQDASGKWVFSHSFVQGSQSDFDSYIEIPAGMEVEDAVYPQIAMKLKQDMAADFKLTVRATSKHALGVNKADSQYSDLLYDETAVEPRKTLVNSATKYVLLEPTEKAVVDVNVLGAGMSQESTVTVDYKHTYTDRNGNAYEADSRSDSSTKAVYKYDASTNQKTVEITVGKNEKGHKEYNSGIGADVYDYNVYVTLKTGGGETCTIIVCISRIDVISLEAEHPVTSSGAEGEIASTNERNYRFSVRFNTDLEHKYLSLMRYLTPDEEKAKRNLATKFTILYTDTKTGKTLSSKSVTIDGDGNVKAGTMPDKKGYNGEYSILVTSTLGSAAKQEDETGYQYINPSSTPHVFVSLAKDTLPANRKLTIRAEAMHPTGGAYTNDGVDAYTNVEAVEKYIEGPQKLEVDSDLVIVEPGQGPNDNGDKEMVVPIYVSNGKTYRITAEISGNSDTTNTKLAPTVKDSFGNDSNPYTKTGYKAGSQWIWYLSLQIGKNERGRNDSGLIDVKLTAYDSDGAQLEEKTIQLAVRRVNEVDLKVLSGSGDINKENKADKKITLQAYPKGYGEKGVKYFARQTKEGSTEVCRWETAGHGAYKTPYAIQWTMEYKGTEKALGKWSDYFSGVSLNKSDTEHDKHRESVTFTLKKALPAGAKLRAYSLHALGVDPDDKSTKYNKAGMEYEKVYGELVIKSSYIVADGFQRADDYDFASLSPYTNMRSYFTQSIYNSTERTFFRFREAGTEWDASNKQYRIMDSEGETAAFFSGNWGSRLFLPNKQYELEIVNVVYGTGPQGQKVIYWPQDENLLEAGNGWAEEGYTLWDGTWGHTEWGVTGKNEWGDVWGNVDKYKEIYELMKNTPQTPHNYLIPRSEMSFEPIDNASEWNLTISQKVKTIGSESSPHKLSNSGSGTGTYYDRHFAVRLTPTSFNIDKTQAHFTATIDKWQNSSWVQMESLTQSHSLNEETYKWFMQVSVPKYDIYHIRPDASGKYRVRAILTGMTWTKITGGLFETGSNRYQNYVVDRIDLFDMSDESGVMYIQLN